MMCDSAHGFAKQSHSRRNAMPWRGARWVWKGNQVEGPPFVANHERPANHFIQFFEGKKLRDGQFADGNDQLRSQNIDFIVHPGRAIPDLVRRGDAVAAGGSFSRETAADGGEVNLRADLFFVHSAELLKPAEKRTARGPGKWFAEHGLFHAGRLADEHDFAHDRAAGNWGW